MRSGHAIIDITADPLGLAANRRHTIRRVGIPIASVILMVVLTHHRGAGQ
jgi:hypothetical protein